MKCIKNYTLLIPFFLIVSSFLFSNPINPVLSIRHDNLDDGLTVSNAFGLEMELGENRVTGFDTDGEDYRIYLGWGFGKIGIGHDGSEKAEYTFGATYEVVSNISMDLDYILGDENNNLRLGIQIRF